MVLELSGKKDTTSYQMEAAHWRQKYGIYGSVESVIMESGDMSELLEPAVKLGEPQLPWSQG
jgi:hypothetical protein